MGRQVGYSTTQLILHQPHGGGKVPIPSTATGKLIDFTARDNPKVKDVKGEEILDDSIVRELYKSGFVKNLRLK